jgi:hypothetical protein
MADTGAASGALQGGLSGAASGAMIGSAAGPVGTIVGGAVGLVAGALGGGLLGKKKKYKAPARASGAVYGYDTYGNLVNKGTYAYNPATGQYELRAGELSGPEKAMRQNLAGNIASLINTVGTTPDAFVRYAKELSDSYYKQGERHLAENVAVEQARLDESLARRGLSTSRAAADTQSELERRRQNTLADIYDQAQRYGYTVQSGLQNQANQAMNTLAGYQGQLMNQDQSYLSKALQAQQLGQAYENAKAGVDNQNIAMENEQNQQLLQSMNQLGSVAGNYLGSSGAGAAAMDKLKGWFSGGTSVPQMGNWMQQGTQWAQQDGIGNVSSLAGSSSLLSAYSNPLSLGY